jgi:siroheme synthase
LIRSGVSESVPCVAVTHASRPEAGHTASRLSGLADLRTSVAPTLLLIGDAFEAVIMRDVQPQPLEQDECSRFAPPAPASRGARLGDDA